MPKTTWTPLMVKLHHDRESRLMTWSEYAAFAGISQATLYNLLNGRTPSRLTEVKLQKAYRTPKTQKATA